MKNGDCTLENVYSSVFESALLKEIGEKSMLVTANSGQLLINMGQAIKMVPMVLDEARK